MSDSVIYYVFEKATGKFAGSGVTFFDNGIYGSTEIPNPTFDHITENCVWDGLRWNIVSR